MRVLFNSLCCAQQGINGRTGAPGPQGYPGDAVSLFTTYVLVATHHIVHLATRLFVFVSFQYLGLLIKTKMLS